VHTPLSHLPPLHDFPQPPQFSGSVAKLDSQPSIGSWLQLPNPPLHLNAHASAWQVAAAFGGIGQTAHVGPHAAGSVSTTQRPAHA